MGAQEYNSYLEELSQRSGARDALNASLAEAATVNPDEHARALSIAEKTGIPAGWVPEFKDEASKAELANSPAVKALAAAPKATGWMSDPDNAKVSHDDIDTLVAIEGAFSGPLPELGRTDLVGAFKSGQKQQWQGRIGYRMMQGEIDPKLKEEADRLEGEISSQNKIMTGKKTIAGDFLEPAAQVLGQMFEGFQAASVKGLKMGGTMGAVGTAMGGPGVGAPAALAGLGAGMWAGFFEDTMRVEAGASYLQMKEIRGKDGATLPEESIRTASTIVGMINGLLEMTGLEALATPWKRVIRKGIQKAALADATSLLEKQTAGGAVATFAKDYARGVSTETLQEIGQEVSNVIAEETLKAQQEGQFDPATAEEIGQRLYDIASQTARAMAVIGVVGPGVNLRSDLHAARAASASQTTFQALADSSSRSKLLARLPEKYREFVDHVAAGGELENVFVPVEQWNTYWQSQNADPSLMAEVVLGERAQYQEANASGSDLVIPTGRYAEKLAATTHHAGLAKDVRFRQGDMTMREAEEFKAEMDTRIADLAEQGKKDEPTPSDQKVFEDVVSQLTAAGRAPDAAAREATLTQAVMRTLGKRSGLDPFQLYQRYALKIAGPLEATGAVAGETMIMGQEGKPVGISSPEFKTFFGKSKVVDKAGSPLTVYHGTKGDIREFDSSIVGDFQTSQLGHFFTVSADEAGWYASRGKGGGGNIVPAMLSIVNPKVVSWGEIREADGLELQKTLKSEGHDGVIIRDDGAPDTYVAFSPNQIKSVFNRGTFDPSSANILEQSAPGISNAAFSVSRGVTRDVDSGTPVFNVEDAATGIAADSEARELFQGVTEPVRGRFLRGTEGKTAAPAHETVAGFLEGTAVLSFDDVTSVKEALKRSRKIKWLEPVVQEGKKELRWGANAEGFYGNDKMAFPSGAYPHGRNTYDIPGCGRESFATLNKIEEKGACYGGACYAETLIKAKQGKAAGITTGVTVKPLMGPKRDAINAFYLKNGLAKAQRKFPDYQIKVNEQKGSPRYGQLSIGIVSESLPAAVVSTKLQNAKGQDLRLGVDTDGAAWLSNPEVMDALLEADPRSLSVYASAYHIPPPAHALSGRSIINVTISGWHPLPETLARLRWAEEARANGWNVILREVVADPETFGEATAKIYNRLHEALTHTDFFMMQQPLHQGTKHGQPLWGLPGCCVGSKKNPRTCDQCEVNDGLGKKYQKYWGIAEENRREEKILPDIKAYRGNRVLSQEAVPGDTEEFFGMAFPKEVDGFTIDGKFEFGDHKIVHYTNRLEGPEKNISFTVRTPEEIESAIARKRSEFGLPPKRTLDQGPAGQGGLFSMAERVATEKLPATIKPQSVMNLLQKFGVKKAELEDVGLEEFLKGKKDVTRQEIVDHIRRNTIQIQEVTNTEGELFDLAKVDWEIGNGDIKVQYDEGYNGYVVLENLESDLSRDDNGDVEVFDNPMAASERAMALAQMVDSQDDSEPPGRAKYGSYALPGGENYRELLMTTPAAGRSVEKIDSDLDLLHTKGDINEDPFLKKQYERLMEERAKAKGFKGGGENFVSSHWDEPNVLAHVRFNDRTGPKGERLLHVEEFQSDWDTKVRQEAGDSGVYDVMKRTPEEGRYDLSVIENPWTVYAPDGSEVASYATEAEARAWVKRNAGPETPPMPFSGNWKELVAKRMLTYAAENGYDGITWVTGQQTSDRYDLSKRVKSVGYEKDKNGNYRISLQFLEGEDEGVDIDRRFSAGELPGVVGKELAEKIVKDQGAPSPVEDTGLPGYIGGEFKVFSGLDLKVGGGWAVELYDKVFPAIFNKIAKRWGGKVGGVEVGQGYSQEQLSTFLNTQSSVSVHHLALPEQMKKDVASQGLPLYQGEDKKRGYIRFGKDRTFEIGLLENADLSTYIHESGHFYLEVLRDLAGAAGSDPQLKADWDALAEHLGMKDLAPGAVIPTTAHEAFARSFEAYLMEGKAPTAELAPAFQRFKAWLIQVYREINRLNVRLNDDVRGIFDRLVATDEEIDAAEDQQRRAPIFATAEKAGMTEAEFASYRKDVERASVAARDRLQKELIEEFTRERKAVWKAENARMTEAVEKESKLNPVFQAIKLLTTGETFDGEKPPEPIRISKDALLAMYGEDFVKKLPPRWFKNIVTKKGGVHPDIVAQMFGFTSGDEMIRKLLESPTQKQWISQETARRMREAHGDLLSDGSIAERAMEAVHNDEAGFVLRAELKALRRKQIVVAPFEAKATREAEAEGKKDAAATARWYEAERNAAEAGIREQRRAMESSVPPIEAFREAARKAIGAKSLMSTRPDLYLKAEQKAAKKAFAAAAKDDFETAAREKQKQLLNHYLYIEARKALLEAEKIYRYVGRLMDTPAQQRLGKAGASYLEQVNGILEQYEFKKVSGAAIERRQSLLEWVKVQEEENLDASIPDEILYDARQVNYRELTMDRLRAVRDALKNIEHLARLKNRLLGKQADIDFADAVRDLVESIHANIGPGKPLPIDKETRGYIERVGDKLSEFDVALLKTEQFIEWADGRDISGPWTQYIFKPISDAQVREGDLTMKYASKLVELFEEYTGEVGAKAMTEQVFIPSLGQSMTKQAIVAAALNTGNESSLTKLMMGRAWTQGRLDEVLSHMDARDWAFVQRTWDTIEELWPDIAALQKRLTGLEPEKVQAREFENEHGTFRGGYYPVIYDSRFSQAGQKQADVTGERLFESNYVRATTDKGHTKERTAYVAPVLLSLEIIPQHFAQVIHDLTYREAVVQADRLLKSPAVREAVNETMGPPYYRMLNLWLASVANDRNTERTGAEFYNRFMDKLRMNSTVVAMGFKATTLVGQALDIIQSMRRVQGKFLGPAFLRFLRHPLEAKAWVQGKSGEMRHRERNLDRDLRDLGRKIMGKKGALTTIQEKALHGISIVDMVAAVPTWMGAYNEALSKGMSDVTAVDWADRQVRLSNPAGGAKDLAAIQRSGSMMKLFTMFYSYFNVLYNQLRDMGMGQKLKYETAGELAWGGLVVVVIPSIAGELLTSRGPDDDDDKALWVIRKILLYPFLGVPILKDIVNSLESGRDYQMTPVAGAVARITKAAASAEKAAAGDKDLADLASPAADVAGYAFGLPSGQAKITGRYIWDVMQGDEEVKDPGEFVRNLMFTRNKHK